jgi:hypothetical protein
MAAGSQRRICHAKEAAAWGTAGTAWQIARALAGAGGDVPRSSWMSEEMRSDRAIASMRMGMKKPTFVLPFELSFGTQEDYLESAFFNPWVAAGTPASGQTVTVVAGTTNTMSATSIGTGLAVGDWVKISGFTGGNVANNGFFKVTAQATGSITLGEAKDVSGASVLTACSSISGITVTKMGYLECGVTEKSLTFEEGFTDIAAYLEYLGNVAKSMSLSIPPEGIIKGQIDFLGKALAADSPKGSVYAAAPSAATTTNPMDGNAAGMALRIDGAVQAIVTKLDLSLDNTGEQKAAAFQSAPQRIAVGRSRLTGSASLYLTGSTYWTKYLAETAVALGAVLLDPAGAKGYAIDIPNCKITSFPKPDVQENDIQIGVPFQALRDSTTGMINWKWWKLE